MTYSSDRIPGEFRWPNLTPHNYRKTSDRDENYTCIAWSVYADSVNIWPYDHPDYFWPGNILNDESVQAFVEFYGIYGYEVCPTSDLEEGFEKIAIYTEDGEVTHAARQVPSGRWTSKLGVLEDIEHDTLEGLERRGYGQATVFMKRPGFE
jgi:hypothetical protein